MINLKVLIRIERPLNPQYCDILTRSLKILDTKISYCLLFDKLEFGMSTYFITNDKRFLSL